MSEIRLVRCPKCDKVLPEPTVYTVYQCGGCGAILKAKKKSSGIEKVVNSETVVDKVIEEDMIGKGSFDMGGRSPARSTFGDGDGSKSSMEERHETEFRLPKSPLRDRSRNISKSPMRERGSRSPMSVRTRMASRSPMRGTDSVGKSPTRTMNGNIVSKFDEYDQKEQEGTGVDNDGPEEIVRNDKMAPKTSFNTWLPDDKHPKESNDNKINNGRMKWRDLSGDEADRISEGKESVYADEHGMISEGLIDNPIHGSGYSTGRIDRDLRFRDDSVGGNGRPRAIGSGEDRVIHRILRAGEHRRNSASLSEVDGPSSYHMDSIHGRSRHSFESQRGPAKIQYMRHHEFSQNYQGSEHQYPSESEEEYLGYRQGYEQQFSPDKHMPRPSYFKHGPGVVHEMENIYNHPPLYDGRPKHPQFPHRSRLGYVPGKSLDFDQDSFRSYRDGPHSHHPACSCSLCNANDWEGHMMSPNLAAHPTPRHSMNLPRHVPRTYDPRMAHTGPRERPSHLAPHARRVLIASQNKRICLPIAGGAPFVSCHSCFELLKLPGKFMTKKHKKEYQLQCGACSSVMSFDHQNRSFDVLPTQKKPDPVKSVNTTTVFGEVLNDPGHRRQHDSFTATSTNVGSYDFDATGHSFKSIESVANEESRGRRMCFRTRPYTGGVSPSSLSKEEHISDRESVQSSRPSSSEIPLKMRPPPGSPLQEHLDYSGQYTKAEAEYIRNYAGEEKQDTSQDSSVVNTAITSENEDNSHELSTSLSDSGDAPKEYKDETKPSSKSPFWRPFSPKPGPASPEKAEVYVNGQQVPLHVIKKAEKLAGSIEPGDYWYDPKAGFWGVMGHHCLGILPPSIQEFSFPMPASCSRGDSAVYVNGRELKKRELNLLSSRGLPTTKNKRYIVDISGKVLEEQSKDFIVNLGKLAPTVEKNKRGFGMRVPEEYIT
ncbi:hypothetical protein SOVF_007700 [Spinacia oleracea]|nr:hypothetical protein SOVF_007700 [Spinacia oleracea]